MDFIEFVERSLALHSTNKIHRFGLSFSYYSSERAFDSCVDSWIRYAIQKGVQQLHLDSLGDYGDSSHLYELPSWLFESETLTSLKLDACKVGTYSAISFRSLMSLSLSMITLSNAFVKGLFMGCPLLEDFNVKNCSFEKDGVLHIQSISASELRLKRLTLEDCRDIEVLEIQAQNLQILNISDCLYNSYSREDITSFEINAPNLQILNVSDCIKNVDATYSAKDMLSLKEAYLDIKFWSSYKPMKYDTKFHSILVSLLENLRHAAVLKLSRKCIQALSMGELQKQPAPILKNKCLILETGVEKWVLPGIACLLRSSHDLETLILRIPYYCDNLSFEHGFMEKHNFDETKYLESCHCAFSSLAHHLKFVKILDTMGVEWLSLFDGSSVGSSLKKQGKVRFVKFLLKNAMVLEKLTIYKTGNPHMKENSEVLLEIAENIHLFLL